MSEECSKDFKVFHGRLNNFIAEAAADGDLRRTFHDFGDQRPHHSDGFQYRLAIIVDSRGEPRIDTDANSNRGDVLVGWPCVQPFTDGPGEAERDSAEMTEQREVEFHRECEELIRSIQRSPENAIELCQLDHDLDKAWIKLQNGDVNAASE